ncbi:MAG: FtsB family cell division protein [Alphaproteobacteria bacterium]
MKFPLRFSSRWLLYCLACSIVLLSLYTIVGDRGAIHLWRLQGEKAKLDEQNYRLHRDNEALRQRILRLRNDDAYLEMIAREELNLVRPGEVIYRFSAPDSASIRLRSRTDPPSKSPPSEEQKSHR